MTFEYTGDRIDIASRVLRKGDTIELPQHVGDDLIANDFPFVAVPPAPDPVQPEEGR